MTHKRFLFEFASLLDTLGTDNANTLRPKTMTKIISTLTTFTTVVALDANEFYYARPHAWGFRFRSNHHPGLNRLFPHQKDESFLLSLIKTRFHHIIYLQHYTSQLKILHRKQHNFTPAVCSGVRHISH